MFNLKFLKRFTLIISNALKQISAQFINIIISVFIINQYSKALWGNFTSFLIYISLLSIITSWGNKEYLLRAFSKAPAKINELFYSVLNARWTLLLLAAIITCCLYEFETAIYLILWLIALFISQSLEVFLNYKKNFVAAIIIELVLFAILIGSLFVLKINETLDLIKCYSFYQLLRAFIYAVLYAKEIKLPIFIIKKNYYKEALTFFLLGLVGFVQSRTDFLVISQFETADNIAIYQVINAYYILIHAVGTFLIFPFIKNIYRLQESALAEIQRKIVLIGPFIVILAIITLYILCRFIYHFELPILVYLLGFGIAYPPYFYAVKIFQLYKYNQQNLVLKTGLVAILLNALLAFVLLKLNYGFTGALIASAIAQIYTAYRYRTSKLNLNSNLINPI